VQQPGSICCCYGIFPVVVVHQQRRCCTRTCGISTMHTRATRLLPCNELSFNAA
jgi:hypothetical protein